MNSSSSTKTPEAHETWREIENLVDELTDLSRAHVSAGKFYAELVDRAVLGLAATAGAVWLRDQDGEIQLAYQTNLRAVGLGPDDANAEDHRRLVGLLIDDASSRVVQPHSTQDEFKNPTDSLLVVCPVIIESTCVALIELFHGGDDSPATVRGIQQVLSVLAEVAGDYQRNLLLRQLLERDASWAAFDKFCESVHSGSKLRETAFRIVNDARTLLNVDRVSLAVGHGRRCTLHSISGQESIDRRAPAVRQLQQLVSRVVQSRRPLWHDGGGEEPNSELTSALTDYQSQTDVKKIIVLPLPPTNGDQQESTAPNAALIVEQFSDDQWSESLRSRLGLIARHASTAVTNALSVERMPLGRVFHGISSLRKPVGRRRLLKLVVLLMLLAGIGAALALVETDFMIEGRGELQPEQIVHIYAPIDGDVQLLPLDEQVENGQLIRRVSVDDPLAEMENDPLSYEYLRITGEWQTAAAQLQSLKIRKAANRQVTPEERQKYQELSAEQRELEARVLALGAQRSDLRRQLDLLRIKSPIDGEVLTWDLDDKREVRPVIRGDRLMTLANTKGKWEMRVRVAEDDIGYIRRAQRDAEDPLDVVFILKSDATVEHRGTIASIDPAAETNELTGSTVMVTVAFDKSELPAIRPGTQVIAKIDCGRRSLGYVWLHDLWDAVRQRVAF